MAHRSAFLHTTEPHALHRAHKRRRVLKMVFLVFGFVGIWYGVLMAIFGWQLVYAGLDGRDALERAKQQALSLQFDAAAHELAVADGRLRFAEGRLQILQTLTFIPWVRTQIAAGETLVHSGRALLPILTDVVTVGSEIVRLSGFSPGELQDVFAEIDPGSSLEDISPETRRAILLRLSTTAEDILVSRERISLVRKELQRLRQDAIAGPIVDVLLPIEEKLSMAEEAAGTFAVASRLLPELAGLGKPTNILLLFLNNAELRPGGGFIGTYGTLSVKDGDIVDVATHDVYDLDNPAAPFVVEVPPEPLRKYLGSDRWFFRDGNWSPDFAVSSVHVQQLFQQEVASLSPELQASVQPSFTPQVIIGFTPSLASALLEITGPISAGGQTFTAENLFETLEERVEFGFARYGDTYDERKAVVGELTEALKKKLFQLDSSRWIEVLHVIETALREKQLVLYSNTTTTQDILEVSGWAGRVVPETVDQLMVVDANLASLKTDPVLDRTISYETFFNSSHELIGRTTIHYAHRGQFTKTTTRYRSYTRVYAPLGSELIRVTGSLANDRTQNPNGIPYVPDVAEDLGMTSFGAFVAIEPGESRDLVFEYLLPTQVTEAIEKGTYSLEVFKQVGAKDHALTLQLDFDKKLASASPSEDRSKWGDDAYSIQTTLDQDRSFKIGF